MKIDYVLIGITEVIKTEMTSIIQNTHVWLSVRK